MADTASITAATISTNQAEDLHNDLDLLLQNNSLPPALPLPSCLPDASFLLALLLTCSSVSCLYELFPLINTAPGVRSNHLIGAPPYLAVNTQILTILQAPGKHTRSRPPLPSPRHQPRCDLYPLPPHSLHAHFVMYALVPALSIGVIHLTRGHSLDSGPGAPSRG